MPDGNPVETITFSLDGKDVTALPGETIWQVAKREGTTIPHLCYADEPGYRADGNCRACMVEIDGERTLAASCIREPSEGMVVRAASERADKARKMVMELLVADQPERDVAHDKSSHLWDMAEAQGIEESRFPALEDARVPLLDDSHVAMRVNLDACIQCNLCVRACREVQVNDVMACPAGVTTARSPSTLTTPWAPRPVSPAASAFRPAPLAHSCPPRRSARMK